MVTSELIVLLANRARVDKETAERLVASFIRNVGNAVLDGNRVELRGFGVFFRKAYGAYRGRNPKTGEAIDVAPKLMARFKPGRDFLKQVNGGL